MKNLTSYLKNILSAAKEKKGGAVKTYVLSDPLITDAAVIISLKNPLHANALIAGLQEAFKDLRNDPPDELQLPPRKSGDIQSGWVILDFNSIFVHLIQDDLREHYELDALYEKKGSLLILTDEETQ